MVDRVTAAQRRLEGHGETFGSPAPGQHASVLNAALEALEQRCPDHVEADRWRQAVQDGHHFLAEWGEQAGALGWTADDLFGLAEPPERSSPFYRRLNRQDATGLVWLLRGRPAVTLTADTALIATSNGGRLSYYKSPFLAAGRARA
jgi:hypothetical protein